MLRTAVLGVVVGLVGTGMAFGQDFELPKPGPEHKQLQELEGTWDAVMDMNGQKSKCKAVYKPICGGMWMESDFEGDLGGIQFQGHGLDGYSQQKKKYVGVWVDSMSSTPLHMEGTFDAESKQLVMTGDSFGPDGSPQKFKTTTDYKDKDHFTFKMYMLTPDNQEQLAFTIEYTRAKRS